MKKKIKLPPPRFRVIRHLKNDNGEAFLKVAFPKATGGAGSLVVPRGVLLETTKARVLFANHGAIIPNDCKGLFAELIDQKAPLVRVTAQAGWHGDRYLTRFGPVGAGASTDTRVELDVSDRNWSRHHAGTAAQFKAGVAPLLVASPYLLFAYLLALAAPLAARIGRSTGFAVCFSAESSTGKTSCLRLAQSLITRANEADLEPFGHTPGILLDSLPYFGGQTVSFGDLKAELSSKAVVEKLRTLVFASSGGSIRLRKGEAERPKPTFNILLLSAEAPLHELFSANGIVFDDGEAVRLLDVPVPNRSAGGIFSGAETSAAECVRELNSLLAAQHGTGMDAWASALGAGTPDGLEAGVDLHSRRFVKSLGVLPAHHARIAEHFGLLAATGILAIQVETLPASREVVLKAITSIFWSVADRLASRDAHTEAAWMAFFNMAERVPNLEVGAVAPMPKMAGFRRGGGADETIFIRRDALLTLVGEPALNTIILPGLIRAGCLPVKGEKTKLVKQLGLERARYYRIGASALSELRQHTAKVFG